MSELIKQLLENNAFDDMRAECPECSSIEDEDYTCITCWDGELEVSNIIYNLQQQLEQKDKELEAYKFNIQGGKNAVRELSDMGALLHTKNKELKARNEKLERVVEAGKGLKNIDAFDLTGETLDILDKVEQALNQLQSDEVSDEV